MGERIGKYEVRDQIGHGGMGTIFKAHDPILDRPVALKVISSEIELTDELRVRFFREAQACARLSHPNIVTVYDMGEDRGKLFIVMEFLEGEELRRLIGPRTRLALEDKLSIMVQVCGGLHYAHQKGIVHRDIKPANIMVLANGQVKILDFGIARIATDDGAITRTGLIMGTLRYIAPEQVRGRADHRSDIFSVGAVFYELLASQPPFSGRDPMQILERVQTEEPPPLHRVDPSIPPELAGIIEQAMKKDPTRRFPDLGQMRLQIEQVGRELGQAAARAHDRARRQHDRLRELQARLAVCLGSTVPAEIVPAIDDTGNLAAMQAVERGLTARMEAVQAAIARADVLAPAIERGAALLQAGRFGAAAAEFEAVVAVIPEHARARAGLREAAAGAAAARGHPAPAALRPPALRDLAPTSPMTRGASTRAGGLTWRFWACVTVGLALLALGIRVWVYPASSRALPPAPVVSADDKTRPVETARKEPEAGPARVPQESPPDDRPSAAAKGPGAPSDGGTESPRAVELPPRAISSEASTPARADRIALPRRDLGGPSPRFAAAAPREPDMERVRAGLARARREAEQAAAGFYAPERLAAAQRKERDADAAVGQAGYETAVRLFGEAQSEYQAAASEARREAETERQVAPLKASVEQSRATARARREQALAAKADRLARGIFEVAVARHREGDDLAARQSFAAAALAYQDAAERYAEAARRVQGASEAPAAAQRATPR